MSQKTFTSDMSGTPDNSHYQQFVLNRANMTDPFSDNDYNSCIEALKKNNAVAINWDQGTVRQLQLVTKSNTGVLKFAYARGDTIETWTVAASSPHTITNEQYTISTQPTLVEKYNDQNELVFSDPVRPMFGIVHVTIASTDTVPRTLSLMFDYDGGSSGTDLYGTVTLNPIVGDNHVTFVVPNQPVGYNINKIYVAGFGANKTVTQLATNLWCY